MPFAAPITRNHASSTGFGGFSLTLNPNGTLAVEVKVHWDFIAGRQVFKGFGTAADTVQDFPWALGAINEFKNTFKTNIPRSWSRKWRFRCTNATYAGTFEPVFTVTDGTAINHNLYAEVHNLHGLSYLNGANGRLSLHKYDNLMYDDVPGSSKTSAYRVRVGQGVLNHLQGLIQQVQQITLNRNGDAWTVSPGDQIALQTVAHNLGTIQQYIGTVPIHVTASSGATGKAGNLVNTVVQFLQGNGVNTNLYNLQTQATKTKAKWRAPWTGHKQQANVTITIDEGNWKFPYRVADHEFGHCIGLPDEYTLYSPDAVIAGSHAAWQTLCLNAGVVANPIPGRLGDSLHNSSIMSYGWVTCACHYVTIWEALTAMTAGHPYNIAANEWVIERGTETQTVT